MPKHGGVGGLAVFTKILRDNRGYSHGNSDEAVLVDARPHNIEPRQAAPRGAPRAPLPPAAFLKPVDRENPRPGLNTAKVRLLLV